MKNHAYLAAILAANLLLASCNNVTSTEETSTSDIDAITVYTSDATSESGAEGQPEPSEETSSEETTATDMTAESSGEAEAGAEEKPSHLHFSIERKTKSDDVPNGDYSYLSMMDVTYDAITLGEDDASYYPALASALEAMNAAQESDLNAFRDEYLDDATEFAENTEDFEYYSGFWDTVSANIRRADAKYVSILFAESVYLGGAHGDYWCEGITFDTQTGEELTLDDFVADKDGLTELIVSKLENITDGMLDEGWDDLAREYINGEIEFVVEPYGITFYFPPYSIAPYAAGDFMVTVGFAEAGDILTGQSSASDTWSMTLSANDSLYCDLDGDGDLENLSIMELHDDDYDNISGVSISIDGAETEFELYAYEIVPTLIHIEDGNTYLYVQTTGDSDSEDIEVYKLEGTTVSYVGTASGGVVGLKTGPEVYEDNSYSWCLGQITDPENFRLQHRTDMLSTYTVYDTYKVGEDGMPVRTGNEYLASFDIELILKTDLTMRKTDGSEVTVPSGTTLAIYGTDGETYCDLKDSDGNVYRVNVTLTPEGEQTIGGVSVYDIFDGVFYAG